MYLSFERAAAVLTGSGGGGDGNLQDSIS